MVFSVIALVEFHWREEQEGVWRGMKVSKPESLLWRRRAKGNSHAVHINTLIFFGFVFSRAEGRISRTKEMFRFSKEPLHDRTDQASFRCKDLVIGRAHVPLKVQGQRQNLCEPQICNHTLQVQVLDKKVWLYRLRTKSVLEVLRGQQHLFVHICKWEQHRKSESDFRLLKN